MHQKKNAQPRNAELSARPRRANTTTTALADIVLTGQDAPRVDSRMLAQHTGVKHKNTLELLKTHRAEFLKFGKVAFQTQALPRSRTGQKESFALLNEEQAYLLLSLSRNTPRVVDLMVRLRSAFSAARKAAELFRSLPGPHLAHDAPKGQAPEPQWLRINANQPSGIKSGRRGTAQAVPGAVDHKSAAQPLQMLLPASGGTAC